VVRRTDEFVFLEGEPSCFLFAPRNLHLGFFWTELIPWFFNEPAPRRREPDRITKEANNDTERTEGPLDSYLAERERPAETALDDETPTD
jgi:hypothetical protein